MRCTWHPTGGRGSILPLTHRTRNPRSNTHLAYKRTPQRIISELCVRQTHGLGKYLQ